MAEVAAAGSPAFAWGVSTSTGQVRAANEDSFVAEPMVLAVADGMGGHQAGEVASRLAVDIIRDRLSGGARNLDVVVAAVVEANAAIFQAGYSNAEQRGMGTTLTGIALLRSDGDTDDGRDAEHLVLVNVGDSRTYVLRNGTLRRASVDHSYVQELVATGHITETEARTHPRRNIVTRVLGIEPNVRVDTWTLPLVRGDRYVLCSDGLVDEVPDQEISDVVAGVRNPQVAADELVAMANRHGGRDNVTVIVVDVLIGADPPDVDNDLDVEIGWSTGDHPDPDDGADSQDPPRSANVAVPPTVAEPDPTAELPKVRSVVVNEPNRPATPATSARTGALAGATSIASAAPKRKRFTIGTFLFLFAFLVIAGVTVALVAIVQTDNNKPTPSTPTSLTTTLPATTTTVASTTTTEPATTIATSIDPTATTVATVPSVPGGSAG